MLSKGKLGMSWTNLAHSANDPGLLPDSSRDPVSVSQKFAPTNTLSRTNQVDSANDPGLIL